MNKTDLYKDYIHIYHVLRDIQKERHKLVEKFELANKNEATRISNKIKELNKFRKQYLRVIECIKNRLKDLKYNGYKSTS